MNEIYWITRFDAINTVCIAAFVIGLCLSVLVGIIYYLINGQEIYDRARGNETKCEEERGYLQTCKNFLKISVTIAIISCLLMVFIPTTKEAMAIYGIGGTIDYIKQNPTARKLPDKCVNALDKWVESWSEKKDSIKK